MKVYGYIFICKISVLLCKEPCPKMHLQKRFEKSIVLVKKLFPAIISISFPRYSVPFWFADLQN